jgi:hypothetical protein
MKYIHLIDIKDDEYISTTATDIKNACMLVESEFEYITTSYNLLLFRKMK